ncbi:hypothetical protein BCR43DRAFT_524362 [Syncephalastrum racemosum]|uniref:Uncharacterized protein n=1 Tax=Syncephalastrum racemosum TaxID=13706 RepID=A0A1X2HBR7_SYNRA|nr:hypothetical protein BCR43DRAFT_524362 [Syncephalastrum racemosum]
MAFANQSSNNVWGDDTGVPGTNDDTGFTTYFDAADQQTDREEESPAGDNNGKSDGQKHGNPGKEITIDPPLVQYEAPTKRYGVKMSLLQRSLEASSSPQGSASFNGPHNHSSGSFGEDMMPTEGTDDKNPARSEAYSNSAEATEPFASYRATPFTAMRQDHDEPQPTVQNSVPAKTTSSYQQIDSSSQIETSPPPQLEPSLLTSSADDSNESPTATKNDDDSQNILKSSSPVSPLSAHTTQEQIFNESQTLAADGRLSSDVTATSTGKDRAHDYMTTSRPLADTSISQTPLPTSLQSHPTSFILSKTASEPSSSQISLSSTTATSITPTSSSDSIPMTSSSVAASLPPSSIMSSQSLSSTIQGLPTISPSPEPSPALHPPETVKNSSSVPGGIAGGILGAALLLAAILAFCIIKKQKQRRARMEDIEERMSSGSRAYNCGACGEETGAWQEYGQCSPTSAHKKHLNHGGLVPPSGAQDPHMPVYHPDQAHPRAHGDHYYNAELAGHPPEMSNYYFGMAAAGLDDGAQYNKYWNQGYPYHHHQHQHHEGHGNYGEPYPAYGECCTGREGQHMSPSESSRGQGITITVSPPANLERSQTIVLQSPESTHSPNDATEDFGATQYQHQQATTGQNVSRGTTLKRATKEEVVAPHNVSDGYYHDAPQLSDRKPDARDR